MSIWKRLRRTPAIPAGDQARARLTVVRADTDQAWTQWQTQFMINLTEMMERVGSRQSRGLHMDQSMAFEGLPIAEISLHRSGRIPTGVKVVIHKRGPREEALIERIFADLQARQWNVRAVPVAIRRASSTVVIHITPPVAS
jgi:hypothetical protein